MICGLEGRVKVVERSLGKVSVVQMARAAASQEVWVGERVEWAVGIAERILVMGRRWPITPVDMTRVLLGVGGGLENCESTVRAILRASSMPPGPVTALAQPALMMIERMPSPARFRRTSWLTVTGAAEKGFWVKTAAAEQGVSDVMRARSGKRVLLALTPT